ncbi:uncharacterized protein CLUP02_09912 [Colletotrichum lupini]|uniref:Uncharacterized protein n=1 Tax=Colletotrichum lupini TaxID=145971 RepID=A0A9Q8SWJ3_9PEZI|nr:uncharacterized protein CLUP02_09912 [Colletotrichum lupini]UQC84415.1 hypothetical protein CLUP02_09912 [Colletotrichum lupini]
MPAAWRNVEQALAIGVHTMYKSRGICSLFEGELQGWAASNLHSTIPSAHLPTARTRGLKRLYFLRSIRTDTLLAVPALFGCAQSNRTEFTPWSNLRQKPGGEEEYAIRAWGFPLGPIRTFQLSTDSMFFKNQLRHACGPGECSGNTAVILFTVTRLVGGSEMFPRNQQNHRTKTKVGRKSGPRETSTQSPLHKHVKVIPAGLFYCIGDGLLRDSPRIPHPEVFERIPRDGK